MFSPRCLCVCQAESTLTTSTFCEKMLKKQEERIDNTVAHTLYLTQWFNDDELRPFDLLFPCSFTYKPFFSLVRSSFFPLSSFFILHDSRCAQLHTGSCSSQSWWWRFQKNFSPRTTLTELMDLWLKWWCQVWVCNTLVHVSLWRLRHAPVTKLSGKFLIIP